MKWIGRSIQRLGEDSGSLFRIFNFFIIVALMISRRPAAIFHPQFWAEDGALFFHDAYTYGGRILLHPFVGYLQTVSCLVALLASSFPLVYAPIIFAAFALFFQSLPVLIILSSRFDYLLPFWLPRLLLCYLYAALPNSFECNINLTNAQWHLAIALFLIIVAQPGETNFWRIFDCLLALLSGLSGPFSIFLFPLAWWEHFKHSSHRRLVFLMSMTLAAMVQIGLLVANMRTARAGAQLGFGIIKFCRIIIDQIILGGLFGQKWMQAWLAVSHWPSRTSVVIVLFILAATVTVTAFCVGPALYRKGLICAAAIFCAALVTPVVATSTNAWDSLLIPGQGQRYVVIPVFLWFSTMLVLACSKLRFLRIIGTALLAISTIGICLDWRYPPFSQTGFSAQAEYFAIAQPGSIMVFPENPVGWQMMLQKK